MLNPVQKIVITSVLRSDINENLKIMVLSYLFYKLCWDFDYNTLCNDIITGIFDYQSYYFEDIQNPCPVGDKTDIIKEV